MKDHLIHGSIAAAVAAVISAGGVAYVPRTVTNVTHAIAVSKHAWPDLSSDEVIALGEAIAPLKGVKIVIMANDAAGADLAEDIDDAVELADRNCNCGISSVLSAPVLPFGYGLGIVAEPADKANAERLAAALKNVSGGRLDPAVDVNPNNKTFGHLIVAIGKYRAK